MLNFLRYHTGNILIIAVAIQCGIIEWLMPNMEFKLKTRAEWRHLGLNDDE